MTGRAVTGRPREPRAVVTGIGIVCASGIGTDTYWKTALSGESRIGRIGGFDPSRYDTTLAGEVPGFEAADHMPSRFIVQTDRWTQLAFCAAGQALADAEIDPAALDPYEMSVALASGSGGNAFGQRELQRLWSSPSHTVGAYQSIAWFYAATVGQLSIMYGMKGPSMVLVSESAGGLDSLAHAARLVRRGTPVVLAGGTEAPLSPYALTCQQHNHAMTARTDPARAYCPFDLDADGYVPGEGGAVLVIEDLDHALARGAPVIYGEIAGAAATFDGRPRPPRRGSGGDVEQYARAMTTDRGESGTVGVHGDDSHAGCRDHLTDNPQQQQQRQVATGVCDDRGQAGGPWPAGSQELLDRHSGHAGQRRVDTPDTRREQRGNHRDQQKWNITIAHGLVPSAPPHHAQCLPLRLPRRLPRPDVATPRNRRTQCVPAVRATSHDASRRDCTAHISRSSSGSAWS